MKDIKTAEQFFKEESKLEGIPPIDVIDLLGETMDTSTINEVCKWVEKYAEYYHSQFQSGIDNSDLREKMILKIDYWLQVDSPLCYPKGSIASTIADAIMPLLSGYKSVDKQTRENEQLRIENDALKRNIKELRAENNALGHDLHDAQNMQG